MFTIFTLAPELPAPVATACACLNAQPCLTRWQQTYGYTDRHGWTVWGSDPNREQARWSKWVDNAYFLYKAQQSPRWWITGRMASHDPEMQTLRPRYRERQAEFDKIKSAMMKYSLADWQIYEMTHGRNILVDYKYSQMEVDYSALERQVDYSHWLKPQRKKDPGEPDPWFDPEKPKKHFWTSCRLSDIIYADSWRDQWMPEHAWLPVGTSWSRQQVMMAEWTSKFFDQQKELKRQLLAVDTSLGEIEAFRTNPDNVKLVLDGATQRMRLQVKAIHAALYYGKKD